MPKPKARRPEIRQQFGAIPFRLSPDGGLEILLVTSRETARWVIPKGWPIKKKSPVTSARIEAFEEAGVKGVGLPELGSFDYTKRMPFGDDWPCHVGVFPLRVTEERDVWPEMNQRQRCWFAGADAVNAVDEAGLADLIRKLMVVLRSQPTDQQPSTEAKSDQSK